MKTLKPFDWQERAERESWEAERRKHIKFLRGAPQPKPYKRADWLNFEPNWVPLYRAANKYDAQHELKFGKRVFPPPEMNRCWYWFEEGKKRWRNCKRHRHLNWLVCYGHMGWNEEARHLHDRLVHEGVQMLPRQIPTPRLTEMLKDLGEEEHE